MKIGIGVPARWNDVGMLVSGFRHFTKGVCKLHDRETYLERAKQELPTLTLEMMRPELADVA
jgi:hypothetical protein